MSTRFLRRNITNLQHQEDKAITARVALQKTPDVYSREGMRDHSNPYKPQRETSHHHTWFHPTPGYTPGQLLPLWVVQSY